MPLGSAHRGIIKTLLVPFWITLTCYDTLLGTISLHGYGQWIMFKGDNVGPTRILEAHCIHINTVTRLTLVVPWGIQRIGIIANHSAHHIYVPLPTIQCITFMYHCQLTPRAPKRAISELRSYTEGPFLYKTEKKHLVLYCVDDIKGTTHVTNPMWHTRNFCSMGLVCVYIQWIAFACSWSPGSTSSYKLFCW